MFEKIESEDLMFWKNIVDFELKLFVSDLKIVHGKKIGRTLGIPTANLNID